MKKTKQTNKTQQIIEGNPKQTKKKCLPGKQNETKQTKQNKTKTQIKN